MSQGCFHCPVLLDCSELQESFHLVRILDQVGHGDCPLVEAAENLGCSGAVSVDCEKDDLKDILSTRVAQPEADALKLVLGTRISAEAFVGRFE